MDSQLGRLKGVSTSYSAPSWVGLRSVLAVPTLLLLTACGGGGGNGSSSTSGNGGGQVNNSGVTMSLSPQSVSVSAAVFQPAPTGSFQVYVTGPTPGQELYVLANYSQHGISNVTLQGNTIIIQFKSPATLGVGTYQDLVEISLCFDQACNQQVSNSPQTVQVQYTVTKATYGVTGLTPSSVVGDGPSFTLTVSGLGFTSQSTVLWNGQPQITTFVSATQLTAQIPATNIITPGSAAVSVTDPTYGNSNSQTITINVPPLAISSISPTSVTVGGPAFTLTVLGKGFTATSTVEWNGVALTTTQISPIELLAQVPASNINAAGTASVLVSDPNSPPGTTSAQTLTIALPSKDATAFQMNPAHTGAVTFNSISFPSAPTWSVNFSTYPSYALIADGKVIVTVSAGNNQGSELVALDQKTGNTVWGPILISGNANAAYDAGRVFVVSDPYPNTQPVVQAFDVTTGNSDWSTILNMASGSAGAPTASNGIVYIDGENAVEALNESTGAVLWTYSGGTGYSTPAVSADGVYTSFGCSAYDLRPATGELIWNETGSCDGGTGTMSAVINQLDYAPDGALAGSIFNAETGVSLGTFVAEPPPAYTQTMGYFLEYSTLRGVTLSNNTVQWTFTGDGSLGTAPIVVNQYVFIGSSLGNVYALNGATGAVVWTVNVGSPVSSGYHQIPFFGIAAGDGLLMVPAGTALTAYTLSTNP